jgi:ABC-type sugar transport system substrate-binding protein
MKKFLLTAAVALGALTVAVSAAQAKYVFALVPKNMNNPFFDQARDGCKKARNRTAPWNACISAPASTAAATSK